MYQQDLPNLTGLISHLSNDELKEMLNDDSKFEEMMKDLKQFKDFEMEKDMLIVSNRSLSDFNLSKEPQLIEGREKIAELSATGAELSKRVEEKIQELKSKTGDLDPETALDLLKVAASEMEKESENIASGFLDGDIELEEFLLQFSERRKLMHLRRVKVDKMSELLSRGVPNYENAPPLSINTSYFPNILISNQVPYPTGPLNMPMPGSFYPNNF